MSVWLSIRPSVRPRGTTILCVAKNFEFNYGLSSLCHVLLLLLLLLIMVMVVWRGWKGVGDGA